MSLKQIKADIVAITGASTDASSMALMTHRINEAARQMYNAPPDLVRSLGEMIVRFNMDSKIIAMPSEVANIRGLRWYETPGKIEYRTIHYRYTNQGYGVGSLDWREIGTFPLEREIANEGRLTFTLLSSESEDVTIYIQGSNDNSAQILETLVIPKETLSVETKNVYNSVQSIRKSKVTTYNIIVSDIEDIELAVIPNHQKLSEYLILQIIPDSMTSNTISAGVEVLFKRKFIPFINDEDEFMCGDIYDQAIVYKYLDNYYAPQKDGAEKAQEMANKCGLIVQNIAKEATAGKKLEVQFERNPMYGLARRQYRIS